MPDQHNQSKTPQTREPTLMLSDLTADLLWVRLLRAPALALNPSRLLIGIVTAFILTVLAWVPSLWLEQPMRILPTSRGGTELLNPLAAFGGLLYLLENIFVAIHSHPWTSLIVGVPMLLVVSVFGCVIARSAALEFAQGRIVDQSETSGFVLRRVTQLAIASLGPLLLAAIFIGLIALNGFLLSVPIVDLLGGLLYALGLILGLLVMLILLLQLLGFPIIISSVACEGTDGFDAIQRSYAYITGRPLRALLFASILFVLGALSFGMFQIIMAGSIAVTDWAVSLLANDAGARVLSGEGELAATQPTANNFIEFWRSLFQLIFAGYVVSYFFTGSTMLYLLLRRICDGQDASEIWEDQLSES